MPAVPAQKKKIDSRQQGPLHGRSSSFIDALSHCGSDPIKLAYDDMPAG